MIVQNDKITACFVNSEVPPVKTEHICYYTQSLEPDTIDLMQVVKETYPHPEAPDNAIVELITTKLVKRERVRDTLAAHIVLMKAQQEVCRTIEQRRF